MTYQVVADCVIVHDLEGSAHVKYRDDLIAWLSDEQAAHLIGLGFVVKLDGGEAVPAAPAAPAAPATPAAPAADAGAPAKPLKTAPDASWVDYGVALGHDRDELTKLSPADLRELLG